MSTSDESNKAASVGKCPFHRGGVDHSAGQAQAAATGGQNNSASIFLTNIPIVRTLWVKTSTTAKNLASWITPPSRAISKHS